MNLLIVDDEPLIHVSIEYSLKESGDPSLRIFHAYNGSEMLQRMAEQDIDIALVDIRMPGMDGLTAIGNARRNWPKTNYYIMSSFSEFEYAREAIKLNVAEYLLKPLTSEQLSEILARVRQEKDREEDQIRESFRAWLVGTLHRHDVSSLFDPACFASVLLFCCDSPEKELHDWLPERLQGDQPNVTVIPCWEGQLALVFAQDEKSVQEILHALPQKDHPEGVTGFITPVSDDPAVLAKEMHRILDLSPLRVFWGIGRRYRSALLPETSEEETTQAAEWIGLRDCFLEKRYADFVTKSSALIPTLADLGPAQLRHLADFLRTVTGEEIPGGADAEGIAAFLRETGEGMIRRETGQDRIDAVIEYVRENYCEDISVARLSLQFDLSPNYLGSLFKKKLGVSFVDYLTSLRIARAKELLVSGNLSVREVAESVGYYSQSYFTKIFIKKEGCTPGEYRKSETKGSDPTVSLLRQ